MSTHGCGGLDSGVTRVILTHVNIVGGPRQGGDCHVGRVMHDVVMRCVMHDDAMRCAHSLQVW